MEILTQEELKNKVENKLKEMGCEDIVFPDPKETLLVALFNCKEITSFNTELPGWTYSGIHLDPTGTRQYKIDFVKNLQ